MQFDRVMKALLVSNATLGEDEVYDAIEAHQATGAIHAVHVVVPITLRDKYPWEAAKQRLDEALQRIRSMGLYATGDLGDNDPFEALRGALQLDVYDRVLIPTLRSDASRWLRMDLISRAGRLTDIPVEGIETTAS